jgi:ubiquinone/menaquinone biosynthesis C-methylase UbiE
MVRRSRRGYYDAFSHFYDFVISVHSRDTSAALRDLLVEKASVAAGGRLLDICTGTGAVVLRARETTGPGGAAVDRTHALDEARRVLRAGGRFLMMEHCEPTRYFVRLLYQVRIAALGSAGSRSFAADEVPFLRPFFVEVKRQLTPTGRSKLIWGVKELSGEDRHSLEAR